MSARDYAKEERGTNLLKPSGVRMEGHKRYVLFQVWDFDGDHYDLRFFIVEEDLQTGHFDTHVMHSKYCAIPLDRLQDLFFRAGFSDVQRIDHVLHQPVLLGK